MNQQEVNKQWHDGFLGATELEFRDNANDLIFEREHYLSKEPIRMDLLIIKKQPSVKIYNEIGHIFKGHNVIEYKSPEDSLSIDDFFKTIAYAYQYKSEAQTVDGIPIDDITVTLVRDRYPRELIKKLIELGYNITEKASGIYYLTGAVMIATQIIVTSRLDKEHTWLRVLTNRIKEEDIDTFSKKSREITAQGDRNNVDAIYQISVRANSNKYEEIKRRNPMACAALLELMRPEMEQYMEQQIQQQVQQQIQQQIQQMEQQIQHGIKSIVVMAKKLNGSKKDAIEGVMEEYGKDDVEAKELVEKYW